MSSKWREKLEKKKGDETQSGLGIFEKMTDDFDFRAILSGALYLTLSGTVLYNFLTL